MEGVQGQSPAGSSFQIDWVRLPLRSLRPSVVVYAIPDVIDTIRAMLLAIGGDAVRLFRSGCFGHFLDYRGGDVQKRVIHALMTYEVHAPNRARVGREAWFHIHHSQLRFGLSEYALVSGLQFGGLTFDPNGDHIVPSRSMYHRLFEGKRTTIKQMEDRSVPGRGSMGVGASGGCGAMELISMGCIFLPGVDALHWPCPQDSIGYGRERIRTVWACEVIPELASEAGVHSGQLTVPRCLRWTFRLPATDPATLLQRASRVVMLVPSPEETETSYYLSLQLEPGTQSVRFVPARSGNKKKMLANVASCCSTSAEEVVPPISPRHQSCSDTTEGSSGDQKRSRSDRSQSSGEPSESFLQRDVDVVMPRVRELIDTTIAPRVQEYVDRTIDRALGGLTSRARRSPTSDVRARHSPEPSDRSAAHRAPTPPGVRAPQPTVVQEGTRTSAPCHGGFSTTYQLLNGIDDSSLQISYSRFRLQGPDIVVQLYFNGDRLWQSWFDGLEDPRNELKDVHMSYFLSAIARRVKRDPGCPTAVANTSLYEAIVGAWKILHPIDPQCRATYGDNNYRRWRPAEGLVYRIQGSDGRYQAIVVCDVSGEHWVVVRIRFFDWVVELYDSLLFQMDDPSDRVEYERRDRELMPLLRLLPRLLICAGFWEGRSMPSRCAFAMTLDKSIPDQYVQRDTTSCGVYACMYVERLLGAGPPPDISEETVHEYQKVIGARIYSLTYIQRPGV
ncbi:hypothetical protein C2S52_000148 [Perilla frutescens var. hirtella]|nr:hypothetical protein C2S52_000148 [Perilla frutescens var. hirtella]